MARQIKNFWLKIGTMFMTLYFMPLSHFVMSLFGRDTSQAYAGTIRCQLSAGNNVGGATAECAGVSSKTLVAPDSVTCTCPTDSSKIQVLICAIQHNNYWNDDQSHIEEFDEAFIIRNACENKPAACTSGATRDCSTTSQYGTQTCTNSQWGTCVYGNCKSGYIKIGSVCTATCSIANGTGYEYDEPSSSSSSSTEA